MTDLEPKEFVLAGVVMKRLVSGEQTEGSFCLFENRSDGQTKTPIHVHADDDETIYVIEGQLDRRLWMARPERSRQARASF